ncbi:DUF2958 domain-containing protein [Rhizobium sp. L43]|uniref:DUF2958 domain-containing protein n=1 Tax=Rhizobium sp. L43 TaxID=2035452 RepID=UPI000BEAB5B2|nr:DUF2958 domain-containing protein [Rhizobium sp. L43]PDS75470.1 single-stranded DNA endonuclease [Rhizobium sp. L43]
MLLVTLEQREQLFRNNLDRDGDHFPVVKLFTPWASARWLITDMDRGDEDLLFGLCDLGLGSPELGYVLLSDLEELRGPGGLRVERDLHFTAKFPLSAYTIAARAHQQIITSEVIVGGFAK